MTDNPAERAARANIHPSTLDAMARVASYNVMEDLGAARFTTGGPCGAIPQTYGQPKRPERPVNTSGWQHEVELSNPPGTALVDKLCDAADARERQAAAQAQHGSVLERVLEIQTALLKRLMASNK